jgi:conjugative transposon TraM protein
MDKPAHSQAFLRQRKFMMVLPLLVLPFVTIFFIALGGGKGTGHQTTGKQQSGINTGLPDANFRKTREKDKMALYEERSKDSARIREAIKNDPYYKYEDHDADTFKSSTPSLQNILQHSTSKYSQAGLSKLQTSPTNPSPDSNGQKVIKKLELLKKVLSQKPSVDPALNNRETNPDMSKLQTMVETINNKSSDADAEVSRLNTMLDKVMLIQHPEKMQDSMLRLSEKNKTQTFAVTIPVPDQNITMLGIPENETQSQNAFFGLSDEEYPDNTRQNCIEAIIPETEVLVSGATVKLRLLKDVFVGGIKIPKDEFIYGTASLNSERLRISVNSIRYQDNILPVSLSVYDLDGIAGIYIPGSINRDVSKESANDAISTMGLVPVDESVGAQAAVAGIQAAKTLAGRKIRLIRVTIKSGYRVLLRDANTK